MLGLKRVHHIAIIATDYAKSKAFYCDILGFTLQGEFYRQERDSWKGDLALNGTGSYRSAAGDAYSPRPQRERRRLGGALPTNMPAVAGTAFG